MLCVCNDALASSSSQPTITQASGVCSACVYAGILTKPFVVGTASAAGAGEYFQQLLDTCLSSKHSQATMLLAGVIAATEPAAPEYAVAMLAAVAEQLLQPSELAAQAGANGKALRKRQTSKTGSSRQDGAAGALQQQETALLVLMAFAKKGLAQCQMVLGLYLCQVALSRQLPHTYASA